jgi:two-component system OmpR family sensor kinase
MSLRTRLLAGMAVVSMVLVAAGVIIVNTTETHLVKQVDDQLAASIRPNQDPARFGNPPPATPSGTNGARPPSALYLARVVDGSVTVLFTPDIAAGSGVPTFTAARAAAAARTGGDFTAGSNHGSGRYRLRAVSFADGSTLVGGLSLHDVDASVHRLVVVLGAVAAIVIAILGLVVFWVLRLGVRPIKRMTRTAAEIAAGDLSSRVPEAARGTEASDLGVALNAMMTRIELAFAERTATEARLRRFVADASHELRTPVTTIRGYAELYRHGGLTDPDQLDQAMLRTEREALRMSSLVDDLLLLARLDEGRPLACAPIDLGVLGVDAAADARAVAPDRAVTADVQAGVTIDGDEDRLRQVVGNLVGNALAHTPDGTTVAVCVRGDAGRAVLEVHDDGPGMAPEVACRAFERFSRADESRSRHAGGSGLGLAIVHAIVVAHGGAVSLRTDLGAGTTVRVELPRVAAAT